MTQNRKPPAYQEYAAAMMAVREFKLMSLAERGLLYTIRLECWTNLVVPQNSAELAKCLGFSESEMNVALTTNVKAFLKETGADYICQDLEDYREHLEEIRLKRVEGGKKGAALTNAQRRVNRESTVSQVARRDTRDSLGKLNLVKNSQPQSLEADVIDNDFVNDYEENEA